MRAPWRYVRTEEVRKGGSPALCYRGVYRATARRLEIAPWFAIVLTIGALALIAWGVS